MTAGRLRRALRAVAMAALVASLAAGCGSARRASGPESPALDAIAWFQTSEENRQLQRSVFAAATRALAVALADPSWRAIDQPPEAVELPPAVIVDVDETMLDNSPFQVGLVRRGEEFTPEAWTRWVDAAEARAIPGAVEFASFASESGVTIFYVTNRDAEHEEATRRNLVRVGLPLAAQPDVLLLRGERPDWTSDKESRRRLVASEYRVLLLVGDDLNDFLSGARGGSIEQRAELAASQESRFGAQWFILPNPLYGSWKRALVAGLPGAEDPEVALEQWLARLRGFE